MLKKIEIDDSRALGLLAENTVSKEDYERVLIPLLEERSKNKEKVRFLYQFGPGFKGFTLGAAWDDFLTGVKFYHLFEKCAVVSDLEWVRHASQAFAIFMPCPVKIFSNNEIKNAIKWVTDDLR